MLVEPANALNLNLDRIALAFDRRKEAQCREMCTCELGV